MAEVDFHGHNNPYCQLKPTKLYPGKLPPDSCSCEERFENKYKELPEGILKKILRKTELYIPKMKI